MRGLERGSAGSASHRTTVLDHPIGALFTRGYEGPKTHHRSTSLLLVGSEQTILSIVSPDMMTSLSRRAICPQRGLYPMCWLGLVGVFL